MQKNWFIVFNVKVTLSGYIIKIRLFLLYLLNSWSVWNSIVSWSVLLKNGITVFKDKVTVKVQNVTISKFGMVMQHHELECHAEFCCCYFQGQGHSEGCNDQNMSLSTIFSELLIPWQPNLV